MNLSKVKPIVLCFILLVIQPVSAQELNPISIDNMYPWCIVAYDSPERSVEECIAMLMELGFKKYAYDWRDRHLVDTKEELELAIENDIEVISVWLWLNAKRDSLHRLSRANEQLFSIVKDLGLKTTFWVSLSGNFFSKLDQEESLALGISMIEFLDQKAREIGCRVALYNHSGWFGNRYNETEIIKALDHSDLTMVYDFHHGHDYMDDFETLVKAMRPHLSAVNLNGMKKNGEKIMPLGSGDREKEMILILQQAGFKGPWGILGHVENVDVKTILEQNLQGLQLLEKS